MSYMHHKKPNLNKTLILLDGNSRPILRFCFDLNLLWWGLLAMAICLCWYQFADDYHRWVQQEIYGYQTVRTVNQLQQNALFNVNETLENAKKEFLTVQKETNYLQYLLGLNPQNAVREIKIADIEKQQVTIQKSMLGNRIEKNSVVLNGQTVLEFYEDIEDIAGNKLSAEQRSVIAAKKLKYLLSGKMKKSIKVSQINDDNFKGVLGHSIIFTVNSDDSKYLSIPPEQLALQWAENINQEIKRIAANRKKINMNDFIALPPAGTDKRIHKEILALSDKVVKENELLADIQKEVQQISLHYAQTPSDYPLLRPISSMYGLRQHPITHRLRFHAGIDFWAWPGTRVHATASGRVIHADWYQGYGYTVRIYHGQGVETLYGHNSKLLVRAGAWVRKGQVIALSGDSGLANGAHLHYEIRKASVPVNPAPYLNMDVLSAAKLWE